MEKNWFCDWCGWRGLPKAGLTAGNSCPDCGRVILKGKFTQEECNQIFKRFDSLSHWLTEQGIIYEHEDTMSYSLDDRCTSWFKGSHISMKIRRRLDPLVLTVLEAHAAYYVSHYYPANKITH